MLLYVTIRNKTRGNWKGLRPTLKANTHFTPVTRHEHSYYFLRKDHFFLFLTPLVRNKYELESRVIFNELAMESGEAIQVSFELWRGVEVKKCGVHLVVDEPNVM
jgi:hypothetical protein